MEFLAALLGITVSLFAVSSMASVGLGYTVRQILDPLRSIRGVLLALAANFLLVPLLAYAVAQVLALDRAYEVGLILVAAAAGAPFVIKLAQMARADVAFSSGLLVLLLLGTIAFMPFAVPLAAPDATVSALAIARPLLLTMLLPLGVGLALRALSPEWAERLGPLAAKVANLSLIALFVLTLAVHLRAILGVFGTGAIMAALFVLSGAFGIGYLFGAFGQGLQDEMALVTAQRNFAAAMVVAQGFEDPDVLVMVVVVSVVTMAVFFPLARTLGRHREAAGEAGAARGAQAGRTRVPS